MQAQVSEARRNWLPQGDILSLLARSPNDEVLDLRRRDRRARIARVTISTRLRRRGPRLELRMSLDKVFTRTEVQVIQPLWDFGKISAGVAAAQGGRRLSHARRGGRARRRRAQRPQGLLRLKLARELLDDPRRGDELRRRRRRRRSTRISPRGRAADGHRQAAPAHGARRGRRAHARGQARCRALARDGLRALLGPDAPADIDVDDDDFAPVERQGSPGHLLRRPGALQSARGEAARVTR